MSVRLKTTLVICVALVGLIISIYAFSQAIYLRSFIDLEEQTIRQRVQRAQNDLDGQLETLNSKTGDWANFDDAYAFMENENPAYIDANPTDTSFVQLQVNIMLFVHPSGRIVYGKAFDLETREQSPVPQDLQDPTVINFLLHYLEPDSRLAGLILLPKGPLLIAARPILTSNGAGPAHGVLVFGRYLDSKEIERFAARTQLPLTFHRLDEAQLPDDLQTARLALSTDPGSIVQPLSEGTIAGYATVKDIFGKPALVLRVVSPRDIYAQGQTSIHYFVGLVSVVALLFGVVALTLTERLALSQQKHHASEERYRTLAETAPDAIYIVNREGRIEYANSAAAQQLGQRLDQMVGKQIVDLFPRHLADGYVSTLLQVFETNQPVRLETSIPVGDGKIYLDTKLVPIKDDAGTLSLVMGVSRDMTESKRAEEFRLKFGLGIERSGEAIFMTEVNGTIVYVNPAFEKIYGYSKGEALGKTPRIIKSGELSQEGYAHFWNTLLAKQTVAGEMVNKTKDGRLITVESSANPILNETGDIIGFLAIQRDITERKRAEQELRRSEEQYRLLFESNPHPMWAYDMETFAFLAVNDAAIRHYGYSRDEFLAMTIKDIRPPEDVPTLLETISKSAASLRETGIWRHRKKDGSIILVEITTHTTTFAGRSARMVLANDVTERKRAEEQVHLQLRRLNALRDIDRAITSSMELHLTLNVLLSQVTSQLNVDAADVLLLDKQMHTLDYAAGHGFRSKAITRAQFRVGEGYAGRALLERRTVQSYDSLASAGARLVSPFVADEEFVVQFATPLIAKGEVKGVLEIFHRAPLSPDSDWLSFLETLAGQAAIAIEDAEMFNNLQRSNVELMLAYDTTLEGWSRALDLRDRETEGHTQLDFARPRTFPPTALLTKIVGEGAL